MKRLALLLLMATSGLLLGTTCENTEILGPVELGLEPGEVSSVEMKQPYVGRLSLDFSLEPADSQSGSIEILAQARQNEDPNTDRCETITAAFDASIILDAYEEDLPGFDSRLPVIESNGNLYELELTEEDGAFEGWARVTGFEGRAEFVLSPSSATMRLVDSNGNTLPPLNQTPAVCDEDSEEFLAKEFRLEDETYRIQIISGSQPVTIYVDETCTSRERVDRTCPGTEGPVVSRTLSLDSDAALSGRFYTTELGVGNAIVVSASCAGGESCGGNLLMTPYIETLECEEDGDCPSSRTCSSDGYCLRESTGCTAAWHHGAGGLMGGLSIIAFLALQRTWRRRRKDTGAMRSQAGRAEVRHARRT
jgi:hypothetical protein